MTFLPRPPAAPVSACDAAPSPEPATAGVTLLVCTTCRGADGVAATPEPGETLLAAVREAAGADATIRIAGVACLANCERRLSAALVADGGWSYVFGRLGVDDAADLLAGAALLADAAGGVLPWRGRPESLKRGLVARIPPLAPVDR